MHKGKSRKTKAAIFDRCLRAVRLAANKDNKYTPVQIENIKRGRKILLTFIRDLKSNKPKYGHVGRALKDVHPRYRILY